MRHVTWRMHHIIQTLQFSGGGLGGLLSEIQIDPPARAAQRKGAGGSGGTEAQGRAAARSYLCLKAE